ncbi:MAG TPA: translation initiation factor IF-2 associated domain-containing protein, partial [Afifellaceae bacterium]|nr:translation initiation factor IF-2 associated domain-containing protein [Afifellaceae bacterium]
MSDTTSDGDKTIRVERRRTISLKRDTDTVRQSFSGGRSKSVVVEKKRRRISVPGSSESTPVVTKSPEPAAEPSAETASPAADSAAAEKTSRSSGVVLRTLTEDERGARAQALADAKVREAEDRQQAEEEARRHAEDEARLERERAEAAARQAEEETRKQAEEDSRRQAEEEARRRFGDAEIAPPPANEDTKSVRAVNRPKRQEPKPVRNAGQERRRGRLTVTNALEDERERSLASVRRRREKEKRQSSGFTPSTEKIVRGVTIPEAISVQDLAN